MYLQSCKVSKYLVWSWILSNTVLILNDLEIMVKLAWIYPYNSAPYLNLPSIETLAEGREYHTLMGCFSKHLVILCQTSRGRHSTILVRNSTTCRMIIRLQNCWSLKKLQNWGCGPLKILNAITITVTVTTFKVPAWTSVSVISSGDASAKHDAVSARRDCRVRGWTLAMCVISPFFFSL